jgi:hypothetical protein
MHGMMCCISVASYCGRLFAWECRASGGWELLGITGLLAALLPLAYYPLLKRIRGLRTANKGRWCLSMTCHNPINGNCLPDRRNHSHASRTRAGSTKQAGNATVARPRSRGSSETGGPPFRGVSEISHSRCFHFIRTTPGEATRHFRTDKTDHPVS